MSATVSQCETFRPELVAFLDGELPPAQNHAVRTHLKACCSCRRESESLTRVWGSLETLATPRLQRDLVGSVMARLRQEAPVARVAAAAPVPTIPQRWSTSRLVFNVFGKCAAAAAVFAGALLLNLAVSDRPTAPVDEVATPVTTPAPGVTPPSSQEILPQVNVDELRARFFTTQTHYNYENQEQSPLLPAVMVMGESNGMKMMMKMDPANEVAPDSDVNR